MTPASRAHPEALLLVYDGDCILCRRSVRWLKSQRTLVPLEFIAASAPDAIARFGDTPDYGEHMIVATDDGRVWVGAPDAYLVAMWSVRGLRVLSYLLAIRPLKPLARRAFQMVTGNRHVIGGVLGEGCTHCAAI